MRIVFGLAALALLVFPANAAELGNALKGSEIQRNARDGGDRRADIWRLAPDGTFTGNYRVSRPASRSYYIIEGQVTGTWRVDNGTLCVEGKGLEGVAIEGNGVRRVCYDVRKGGFAQNEYVATNRETGFRWQVFVYPPTSG